MNSHPIDKIKQNEQNHFNDYGEIQKWWLKTLEDDGSFFRKKILKQTLRIWDKDIGFIKPELYRNKAVLDAGCGNMRYASYLKCKGAKLCVGGDITAGFIKDGFRKKSFYVYDSKVTPSSIKALQLDCEDMPTKINSFDMVLFFHSIHHISRKNRAISQAFGALKKGGHVIISDLNGSHFLRGVADRIGKKMGVMSPDEKAPSPKETLALLEKNGFEILEVHYMNPFSEILFHAFNIVGMFFYRLSLALKASFFIINPVESVLEKTISGIFPNLFWRYIIIAKKV